MRIGYETLLHRNPLDAFVAADEGLLKVAKMEGLPTLNPVKSEVEGAF